MIVIIIIAALCTGVLCGAASFYWLGVHEIAALLIGVGITGAVNFSILAYIEKVRCETYDFTDYVRRSILDAYKAMLECKNAEIEACCRDLKKADIDCQYCANIIDNAGIDIEKCLQMNNCNECTMDCACKHCSGNSNWKWRGVCDDNDTEE